MIEPTSKDVGKKVVYYDDYGKMDFGVITGFNHRHVFVQYGSIGKGQPTSREDLRWSTI